ncbi:PD40 domain-containing protein [Candidatus Dependentiae bacterium]|nr:PD40 domain-containing protein [Candidatus Dependentiae bacterium]
MKLLLAFFICFFSVSFFAMRSTDFHINVKAQQTEKSRIGLVFVGEMKDDDEVFLARLQKDLEYSQQCVVIRRALSQLKKVDDLKNLFSGQNVYLAVFVTKIDDGYVWRLYDLLSAEMLVGKKVLFEGKNARCMAHIIADQLWPALMNKKSSFASKIAFCKQIWKKRGKREKVFKQIWITDFDGTHPQLFIDTPTINIAPRWGILESYPILFYSENTLSNVQLVMSNMFKKRQVVYCFDGLNMQPTFSSDGKEIIYCLSKDGSTQLYHSYVHGLSKHRLSERLTLNDGNNIAPCFINDNTIVFVSDFETNKPQLYLMNINNQKIERITDGGYCACPSYCKENNQLVYSKMIDREMQLFLYNLATKQHIQLTHGRGSKEEPSWSACGNYIVFCINEGSHSSRIAQFNLIAEKWQYLTPKSDHCTYPNYSPVYQHFLGILKD